MSKRRVAREVEELSEEVLGELTPLERLQLLIEAKASGNEHWVDHLFETCPRFQYTLPDLRFTEAVRTAQWFAWQAVYDLQTLFLEYKLLEEKAMARHFAAVNRDEAAPDAEVKQTGVLADATSEQFAALYVAYHSHRRFATEYLGVEFDAWLSLHPEGATLRERVEALLAVQSQHELAEAWFTELQAQSAEGEAEREALTLDDVVAHFAEARKEIWNDFFDERII